MQPAGHLHVVIFTKTNINIEILEFYRERES